MDGMRRISAVGLMSGTSLDGIDIALLNTDGEGIGRFGPTGYRPYDETERACLSRALTDAASLSDRNARPGALKQAEDLVTRAHAEAVEAFLVANGIERSDVAVIGFHGQTVLHRPEQRLTVQIGDGHALARRLRIAVVYDFRAADVAAGGQGAPLVPIFHRALAESLVRPHPIAVLNIGGVANVTYIDGTREPIACDVGPGNALIDDFMRARTGKSLDRNGENAARGRADEKFIAQALAHPFFAQPPPKSLDRNAFANFDLSEFSVPDGAATLTALTAAAVARVLPNLPQRPRTWIVGGGGAHNATLVRMLSERLQPAIVEAANAVGWSADALEAQAFAYLAVRSLRNLPITFPSTTGADRALAGGVLVQP
jgi:anhydro-N-acetylmuramic acid kinase